MVGLEAVCADWFLGHCLTSMSKYEEAKVYFLRVASVFGVSRICASIEVWKNSTHILFVFYIPYYVRTYYYCLNDGTFLKT